METREFCCLCYDNNGNTITDGLKNLQISYNILNLQEAVTQGGTILATYGWFADGSKWSVENTQGNGYRYIGSLIYNTGSGGETTGSAEFSQRKLILYKSVMKNLNMTNEMKLKKNYRH